MEDETAQANNEDDAILLIIEEDDDVDQKPSVSLENTLATIQQDEPVQGSSMSLENTLATIQQDEPVQGSSMSLENTLATTKEDDPVMIDLKNKMAITYNILKACIKEKWEQVYYYMDNILNRLAFLSNLPKHILSEIMDKAKEFKTTHVLEETLFETPDRDLLIRQTLVKNYVTESKIPTSESLARVIKDHLYNYQLHEQLKRSGYIWRRLGNTKRAIIVEHPKRVIERQRYLQKIISYRNENRPLVYIETKIFSRADEKIPRFQMFFSTTVNFIVSLSTVINTKGYLSGVTMFSESIYECQKLIEDYIIKNVIPSLTEPSVIILEDKPYFTKSLPVPTVESEKCKMIEWLEINGIPYENTFHRCELFELIQRCKPKSDLHKFDAALHAHDHDILRRPSRTNYLNYFNPVTEYLSWEEEVTSFSIKKPSYWKNLENTLIAMEKTVFHQDLAMDDITDKILTLANDTDVNIWAESECSEEVDSLVQEEFLVEIQNSFSPEELQLREQQFLSEITKFTNRKRT